MIIDATKEWTFKDNHFDYIHIQFMNGAVENWTDLYKQAYRCCKPGGWIEHIDVSPIIYSDDGTVTPGSAMDQYGKILSEAGIKINRRTTTSQDGVQEAGMKEAGFVSMTVKDYKVGCLKNIHIKHHRLTCELRCPYRLGLRIRS